MSESNTVETMFRPDRLYEFRGELSGQYLVSSSGGNQGFGHWTNSIHDTLFEIAERYTDTNAIILRGWMSGKRVYSSPGGGVGHMYSGHHDQPFVVEYLGTASNGAPRIRLKGAQSGRYMFSSSHGNGVGTTADGTHGDTVFHVLDRYDNPNYDLSRTLNPDHLYRLQGESSKNYLLSSPDATSFADWSDAHGDTIFRITSFYPQWNLIRLTGSNSGMTIYSSSGSEGGHGQMTGGHPDQNLIVIVLGKTESGSPRIKIRGELSEGFLFSSSSGDGVGFTSSGGHADVVFEVIDLGPIPPSGSGSSPPSGSGSSPPPGTPPGSPPGSGSSPSSPSNSPVWNPGADGFFSAKNIGLWVYIGIVIVVLVLIFVLMM